MKVRMDDIRQQLPRQDLKANSAYHILIVDDERSNRQVLKNHLSILGYQLHEAESGAQALVAIKEHTFDIVLLDIMMPKMSGYEFCARVRKNHALQELPIIIITAKNLIADLIDGFEVGANDFLTKPISKGELTSRVRTHLQLRDFNLDLEQKVELRTHEVEQTNQVLRTLDNIVASINREVRRDRLLEVLLREAVGLFASATHVVFWQFDPQDECFHGIAAQGFSASAMAPLVLKKAVLLSRYIELGTEIGEGIHLVRPTDPFPGQQALDFSPTPKSIVTIQINKDEYLDGLVVLKSSSDPDAFNHYDINTFHRFREHAKTALSKANLMDQLRLQNQKLQEASLTDQLTGLHNRRYLIENLQNDMSTILRNWREKAKQGDLPENSELVFFMMDVDHFKQINDRYGHAAGDAVLVQITDAARQVFRSSDYLTRWGGEEFLFVTRFTSKDSAPQMAERLRSDVERHRFDIGEGRSIRLSCSVGFASFPFYQDNLELLDWSHVVDVADHCLYAAKRNGRNGWVGLLSKEGAQTRPDGSTVVRSTQKLIEAGVLIVRHSFSRREGISWE